jgi:hypothetical protein
MSNPVGRPLTYKTVQELDEAIELYFETDAYMGKDDTKHFAPTMSGLAYALGIDRKTLHNYTNNDEFFPSLKKAKARVETALEQRLYAANPAGVIFNLKNNYSWTDKQEIDHQSSDGSMSIKVLFDRDNS